MTSIHSTRRSRSFASQSAEMAMAVPQVVAHRMVRMAAAGATPSQTDRDEFKLMSDEKVAAFQESWVAMATQVFEVQQQMAQQMMKAFWFPLLQRPPTLRSVERQWRNASFGILGKGMEPISRRAIANAKRLGAL